MDCYLGTSGSSPSSRVGPEKIFETKTVVIAGTWDLQNEISAFKKVKKMKWYKVEKKKKLPTHPILLVNVSFSLATSSGIASSLWKASVIVHERHCFQFGPKLAWTKSSHLDNASCLLMPRSALPFGRVPLQCDMEQPWPCPQVAWPGPHQSRGPRRMRVMNWCSWVVKSSGSEVRKTWVQISNLLCDPGPPFPSKSRW